MKFLPFILWLTMSSVFAASTPVIPKIDDNDFAWMKDDFFKQEKASARTRASRSVATASEVNDQMLSPKFKEVRAEFLKIKTGNELKTFIAKLDANYANYPDDLKLMTAMLTPLLKFKAFTYKIYPFVAKEKITHSVMLSQVQNFASFMNMNLPTQQWRAGFDLVTEPSDEEDLKRFENASSVQLFMAQEIYPAYRTAANRIKQLNFSKNTIVWDNQIFYGTASFSDNLNRYQLIGEAEKYSILASLHYSLADICKFVSYNIDDLLPFISQVAKLYGYDSFLSAVDGVTAEKIANVYKSPKFSNLFKIHPNGQSQINLSFKHIKEGSRNLNLAWIELRDRQDRNQAFIRSAMFTPFSQVIENQIEGIQNVLEGKTSVRSDITGEMITVDLPAFYAQAPTDLKELLPIEFDKSPRMVDYKVQMKNGKTKSVEFRNYFSGRSTNWKMPAYKNLFPELTKGSDIAQAMKILNQSVYGGMVAMTIQPFMLY
jgi:hypothetical protein